MSQSLLLSGPGTPGPKQIVLQKFLRLYLFVAIPAVFWLGVAGLLGAIRLGRIDDGGYVFMSPGVGVLLVCASVCLQMATATRRRTLLWAVAAAALLLSAWLTDRQVPDWHGERDTFLNIALIVGGLAVLLAFRLKPEQGGELTPTYASASVILTLVGTFASVMGSYLMVERDLAQGQHYVQTRAEFVGHTLKISFDQPIGSIQRMADRWKSMGGRPAEKFVQQEFRSHIRDMPSIVRFSLIERDGRISTDVRVGTSGDDLESLLKSEMAFWAFLDSVHRSGEAGMSTPGLVPGRPEIAFVAAPLGEPVDDWSGVVVATVDLTVLVEDAFTDDPPCCFVASGNSVSFFQTASTTGMPPVAIAHDEFHFPRVFPFEVTFWKEKLPGEVGMSSYPVWVLVIGLLFTFFSNASQRLAQLALHRAKLLQERTLQDPLTGLPNRRKLRQLLQSAFRQRESEDDLSPAQTRIYTRLQNQSQALAGPDAGGDLRPSLMFIDMQGLRLINDSLGHELGDRLIVKLAVRLKQFLDESSCTQMGLAQPPVLARVDAGEFVVFLNKANDEVLTRLAEAVLDVVEKPVNVDSRELTVSASIGISSAQGRVSDPMQLVREADLALLAAKQRGTRALAQYSEGMGANAALRMELTQRLKTSLAERELYMVYQPLVDVRSGQIKAMEALVRWNHPDYGFISPAQFIPMAEESGQIVELTNWTLWQACSFSPDVGTDGRPTVVPIAVNISPVYFQREDFVDQIRHVVLQTGVSPDQLQLEITEGVLLRDQQQAVAKLTALQRMGFVVSLDDFGTGYSSLSYLKNLPVQKVKLDRSFVVDVTSSKADADLVRGVIEIVHNLNMVVVVEGVETAEQASLLRSLGSDQFQGYLFSRPLTAGDVQALIRERRDFRQLFDS